MKVPSPRGVLRLAIQLVVLVLALLASALLHLKTELGLKVATDLLNVLVSDLIAGRLEATRVDEIGLERIVVREVSLYDPDGTRVIYGEEITLKIDPLAAIDGTLRFSHARLRRGRLRLEEDATGELTFLRALEAADTTPSDPASPPFHAIVDDMYLDDVRVYGELLGLSGIHAQHVYAHGRMEFEASTVIDAFSGHGEVTAPFGYVGYLDRIVAHIDTDDRVGTDLYVRGHTGEDRVRVNLHYGLPVRAAGEDGDVPLELDLRVAAEPVSAATLAASGFEWASLLRGQVRGGLRLFGPPDHLRLEGRLSTDGGRVDVLGELPSEGDVVVQAESPALALAGLVEGAPEATLTGGALLRVPATPEGAPAHFEAHAEPFEIAGYAVPAIRASGRLLDSAVALDELEGSEDGGKIFATGMVGYDGSYHLAVDGALARAHAEPNLAAAVPGLRGGVRFEAHLDGDAERTHVRGTADFRSFGYDEVRASRLTATGRVVVDDGLPTLDLRIAGREVRVAGLPLGSGSATLTGTNGRYRFHSDLRDTAGRASGVEGELRIHGDVVTAEIPRVTLARGGVAFQGAVAGIRVTPSGVEVGSVRLERGDQRVDGQLAIHDRAPDTIDLAITRLSLDDLRRFFGPSVPAIGGEADLTFRARGEIDDAPTVTLEGALRDVTLAGVEHSSLVYRVQLEAGNAELEATASLADQGDVRLAGTAIVEGGLREVERLVGDGIYDLDVDATAVSVAVLNDALGGAVPGGVDGRLSGHLELEGPPSAPTFRGTMRIPDLALEGWPAMSLTTAVRYEYGSFSTNAVLADEHGTLVEGEGSVLMDVVYAIEHPDVAISTLDTSPWRFSIRVPPRPMADVPLPILASTSVDLTDFQLAGSLTLAGGAFQTRGHLIASIDYQPDDGEALCGVASEPRATLVADLAEGQTDATLHAVVGGRRVATIHATAETPLDAWLHAAALPEPPPTTIEAVIHQAPADAIPLVCERMAGYLEGTFSAHDLFGQAPTMAAEIYSDRLRVRRLERSRRQEDPSTAVETPPIKIRVGAGADGAAIAIDSDMQWWNGGSTHASARFTSTWAPGAPLPTIVTDGPASAAAELFRMPLEAVVAWVPGLANVDGLVEGEVHAEGTLADPHLAGSLDVTEGQLDLRGLGQRLRNVHGHVDIAGGDIELVDFSATDGDGVVHIDGLAELAGLELERSTLRLAAQAFPIRQEGSVMAELTGRAEITNEFHDNGLSGAMRIGELVVQLPDDSGRSPQDLAAHPDICVHRRSEDDSTPAMEGDCGIEVVADEDAYAIELAVDASRPFWVKSSEFEALVTARLDVLYRDPDFRVGGEVELRQGFFEVFGKRFDIDEGSMVFDARSPTLNPEVLLIATHRLRNDPNRTVTVHASGTLAHPVVEFSSTVPTNNEGEIIALLITGSTAQRRQSRDTSTQAAGQEAANFLAGVAFGVASLSLREEFGEHFPVISVETADSGFRSARIRAGFTADDIIPERMRSVVEGVYIEGYFTAGGNQGAAGSTGATTTGTGQSSGFLIELQFPHNIVGTGTFSPGSNWGVDLTWEP